MDYQENTEKLSPEEMDRRKEEMLTFYKDSMPYLDAQLGYETKLMEVDEVRFKRLQISMQSAMMLAQNENQQERRAALVPPPERSARYTTVFCCFRGWVVLRKTDELCVCLQT